MGRPPTPRMTVIGSYKKIPHMTVIGSYKKIFFAPHMTVIGSYKNFFGSYNFGGI